MGLGPVKNQAVQKQPFNISADDTSTNQETLPVTYFAGVAKIPLTWGSEIYNRTSKDVEEGGGKKGVGATKQKKWYGDILGFACYCPDDAPVDSLLQLIVNGEPVYTGPLPRIAGSHYSAFSVTKYCTDCRIWWGTKNSPFDDHILAVRSTALPVGGETRDPDTWDPEAAGARSTFVAGGRTFIAGVANPKSGHYDTHPPYKNICRFTFRQFFLGASPNMPNVEVIIARGTKFFSGARFETTEHGVNPMGPAYEIFIDDLAGPAFPESRLVAAGFQNTADALDGKVYLAPVARQSQSLRTTMADYLQYYNGFFRRNGSSLEAGFWERWDAIDLGTIPELDSDDIAGEPQIKPGNAGDGDNSVSVVFTNRTKYYFNDTAISRDLANIATTGKETKSQFQRPHIIDADDAQQYADEYVKTQNLPNDTGSQDVKRDRVGRLLAGTRVKIDYAGITLSFVWRITAAQWPSDRDGTVTLTIENERAIGAQPYIQPSAPKVPDFVVKIYSIPLAKIFELPSGLKDARPIEIVVLAQRPTADTIGFKIHSSIDDSSFHQIGAHTHFAVYGKIGGTNYSGTTADVDTTVGALVDLFGTDLGFVVSQTDQQRDDRKLLMFYETGEIASVGTVTPVGNGRSNIKQARGLYGTDKTQHNIGEGVWFIFRSQLVPLTDENFALGATRHFKFQPYTHGGDHDLMSISSVAYNFKSTSAVPTPILPKTGAITSEDDVDPSGLLWRLLRLHWDWVRDADITGFVVTIVGTGYANPTSRHVGLVADAAFRVPAFYAESLSVLAVNRFGEESESDGAGQTLIASLAIPRYKIDEAGQLQQYDGFNWTTIDPRTDILSLYSAVADLNALVGALLGTLAAPTFQQSHNAGVTWVALSTTSYLANFFWRILSAGGTAIYFTVDGTEPFPNNPNAYNSAHNDPGGFFAAANQTNGFNTLGVSFKLRARAFTGVTNSGATNARWAAQSNEAQIDVTYAPDSTSLPSCSTPTIRRVSGSWGLGAVGVQFDCSTSGATIHYSTDASNYSDYTPGDTINVPLGDAIFVFATAPGFNTSDTQSAYNDDTTGSGSPNTNPSRWPQ
jgi:hypothetical protein